LNHHDDVRGTTACGLAISPRAQDLRVGETNAEPFLPSCSHKIKALFREFLKRSG
jgi:hypothetical protein